MSADRNRQRPREDDSPSRKLRAVVERYEEAPNECTIYPVGIDEHERMATWVSAAEPAFVELEAVR